MVRGIGEDEVEFILTFFEMGRETVLDDFLTVSTLVYKVVNSMLRMIMRGIPIYLKVNCEPGTQTHKRLDQLSNNRNVYLGMGEELLARLPRYFCASDMRIDCFPDLPLIKNTFLEIKLLILPIAVSSYTEPMREEGSDFTTDTEGAE